MSLVSCVPAAGAADDQGPIRLRTVPKGEAAAADGEGFVGAQSERRGFDYEAFDARLESLWFQRKASLATGRDAAAARQAELLQAFVDEEGVGRLENVAGALVAEARRFLEEGSYDRAFASLDLAGTLDPGRPQTHLARATALWRSGRGRLAALAEASRAARLSVSRAWKNLSLVQDLALVAVLGVLGSVAVFALVMALRYQVPFRHEVEEWVARRGWPALASPAGWALLLLPLLLWAGAGWILLYWVVIMFRFMRRAEKVAAVVLLAMTVVALPAYRMAVALYGVLTDPAVRTTLAAATGAYDPDRILELRDLVEAHPKDPEYRFLLGTLYKSGHFFEEAYDTYRQVLDLDPACFQAHINIGNIFFQTGRHAEAVAQYRKALEIRPSSVLAYYNMYLAQSEAFHFKEAEETIARARQVDHDGLSDLLSGLGREGERAVVVDAGISMGSVWRAAIEGRPLMERVDDGYRRSSVVPLLRQLLNPLSLMTLMGLAACPLIGRAAGGRAPARRCIRCGRPFCHFCKTSREGQEYCSQCVHLFVLGDGLAPETKTRKLYEVERFARLSRRARRAASLLLPGTAQMCAGRTARGVMLVLVWLAALIAWKPAILNPFEWAAGADLRLDLLQAGTVPVSYGVDPSGVLALAAAASVWVLANLSALRPRES